MIKFEFQVTSEEAIGDVLNALDNLSWSYKNLKITDGDDVELSTDLSDYYQSSTEWYSSSC